ncbi:putative DNA-binding transcriptional regulator YafY, contains an HTH and WYL domains [Streptoalloteichus tenebrarius]|uniref:DNA-binding transcriptional regulator YafY, contains an HTH and WYL domains n=1 Tax=Streptoalloteichus tenebrarius (strain ATCC 17920 / DSM 40477 / JCM 4838 / CBS 697.72 / NBRC 16177 / NCIMB 11028 / NRRL B-12390 / A12253. 1 / ISP 5477) TaxID=1933 RepID=A0ABT1HLV2_STRSD|nr:transcriptional regulator [Streptoalloteichus tenebrarius]MCP2256489.1 putative DNA-binding transcriptional regulator YafY, contains an HTH and WYL domains [Streptoalloteichus tenebrarius]BFF04841.1 YafY family protein [Streptoalloteichus tenebrarius]
MVDTSARLLRLLALLQTRRDWATADLAERLGVAARTIRRDMGRLRGLGYPVHSTPGVAGGYRLGAGAALPPLLLDDDEAVAVTVGLRTAADGSVSGIEEASVRALAKLEHLLPARLRHRVATARAMSVPSPSPGPKVDVSVLTALAAACRDHHQLRFDYRDHNAVTSLRTVEPHHLVYTRHRWYLVAFDRDREDWRSFRADRLTPRVPTGPRFTPRQPPAEDLVGFVTRGIADALWRYRARVVVRAPAASVADRLPPTWVLETTDADTCVLDAGADTPHMLAVYLAALDVDFDVLDAPELTERLGVLARRFTRAASSTPQETPQE